MRQVCCLALPPPPPVEKARCSSYSDSSSSERSSSSSGSGSSGESGKSSSRHINSSSISRPAAPPKPRPPQQPQPRSPADRRAAARSRAAAAGGMRRDPAPGFSMLLFGVSLACYSPSLKSVQDQAYKAPVVVEGKVQGLAPAGGGSSSNSTREPPASGRVALVKVLDKWPLRSGGLQREQVISVGSCAPLERNQRYIFFLEPTEQPLVFKTAFAPLNTNGKNLKKEVGKILCTDCEGRLGSKCARAGGRGDALACASRDLRLMYGMWVFNSLIVECGDHERPRGQKYRSLGTFSPWSRSAHCKIGKLAPGNCHDGRYIEQLCQSGFLGQEPYLIFEVFLLAFLPFNYLTTVCFIIMLISVNGICGESTSCWRRPPPFFLEGSLSPPATPISQPVSCLTNITLG
ncbi:hypothetical protein FD755_001959 [Muntiacus reevesi]|uniref:Neuregulin 2 N-terminal domain-containing protein n=1 Tax=Muntiacus reevesi TaxID=9886 RepID=A0A5J5N529_MUNRE|nr:hypothetical protein FD755_001959 [Muntiacus reevesi]